MAEAGNAYAIVRLGVNPRSSHSARGNASWQEQFLVTIFGDEGVGFFQPCVSVGAYPGNEARARFEMPGELPVIAGGTSGSVQVYANGFQQATCAPGDRVDPGNYGLGFYFNVPFLLNVTLTAEAFALGPAGSGASAVFHSSLVHSRVIEYSDGGGTILPPVSDPATWTIEPVPEPNLGLWAPLLFAGLVATRAAAQGRRP